MNAPGVLSAKYSKMSSTAGSQLISTVPKAMLVPSGFLASRPKFPAPTAVTASPGSAGCWMPMPGMLRQASCAPRCGVYGMERKWKACPCPWPWPVKASCIVDRLMFGDRLWMFAMVFPEFRAKELWPIPAPPVPTSCKACLSRRLIPGLYSMPPSATSQQWTEALPKARSSTESESEDVTSTSVSGSDARLLSVFIVERGSSQELSTFG